jgi:Tfp pilus assembly protein PilO
LHNRRKTLTRIFEGLALALVAIDLLLGLGVHWLSGQVAQQHEQLRIADSRLRLARARVARLEHYDHVLPDAQGRVKLFFNKHVPTHREGFSRAASLMRSMTEKSGVQLTGVTFKPNPQKDSPLQRLTVDVVVTGPFPKLVEFARDLETASDFLVLHGLTFAPGENNQIGMRVTADLYVTP